jgi:hypothetical protein
MVWAEYFGRAHVGTISALGRPLGLMVGASGPFLLAFTRDLTGGDELGILLNALSAALCFGCLLLVRPARRPAPGDEAGASDGRKGRYGAGNEVVLVAEAPMELSGRMVAARDGKLGLASDELSE